MLEIRFHHVLGDAVNTRRARSAGPQCDARRFTQPVPVSNQSQEAIELAFSVLRRPCRQLALHFTDYQRSSPHSSQLINQANHFNCLPSPCSRISRPRTSTEAPSACTSSGTHSLNICASLPQFTCWTSSHGRGRLSQSFSLLVASRRKHHGLATRSPWLPAKRHTYPLSIRAVDQPYVCSTTIRVLPEKRCRQG